MHIDTYVVYVAVHNDCRRHHSNSLTQHLAHHQIILTMTKREAEKTSSAHLFLPVVAISCATTVARRTPFDLTWCSAMAIAGALVAPSPSPWAMPTAPLPLLPWLHHTMPRRHLRVLTLARPTSCSCCGRTSRHRCGTGHLLVDVSCSRRGRTSRRRHLEGRLLVIVTLGLGAIAQSTTRARPGRASTSHRSRQPASYVVTHRTRRPWS